MATGDQNDIIGRLRAALPRGWFPDTAPILTGVLTGLANTWSWAYSLLTYAKQQTRIATATEGWLDAISVDLFGDRLPRRNAEPDAAYRLRIQGDILQPANTRAAIVAALTKLTGETPQVFEPANAGDTGAYSSGGLGYNCAGGYGSYLLPFQAFIQAYRGITAQGIPVAAGYGDVQGGYGRGQLVYGSASQIAGLVTDADIYATVADITPAGSITWVAISDGSQDVLGYNFVLGQSSVLSGPLPTPDVIASGDITAVLGTGFVLGQSHLAATQTNAVIGNVLGPTGFVLGQNDI